MAIVPVVGASSPAISRSSVVLPTPLAPTRATRSPLPTVKLTSRSSSAPPGRRQPTWLTWIDPIAPHARSRVDRQVPGFAGGASLLGTFGEVPESGRMDRTANAGTTFKWSVGSNPTLSALVGGLRPPTAPRSPGRSTGLRSGDRSFIRSSQSRPIGAADHASCQPGTPEHRGGFATPVLQFHDNGSRQARQFDAFRVGCAVRSWNTSTATTSGASGSPSAPDGCRGSGRETTTPARSPPCVPARAVTPMRTWMPRRPSTSTIRSACSTSSAPSTSSPGSTTSPRSRSSPPDGAAGVTCSVVTLVAVPTRWSSASARSSSPDSSPYRSWRPAPVAPRPRVRRCSRRRPSQRRTPRPSPSRPPPRRPSRRRPPARSKTTSSDGQGDVRCTGVIGRAGGLAPIESAHSVPDDVRHRGR